MNEQGKGNIVVKVPHRFSGNAVKGVVAQVHEALGQGAPDLVFDFIDATSVDSFGIGQLITLAKELREKKVHMTLRNLNDEMFQLFVDTGLDQVFAIEGVKQEVIDLFESSVEVRLGIEFEDIGDVRVFKVAGVMDNIRGSRFFKQKFLLSLATHRNIVLDFTELTFYDSLSVSVLLDMHKLLKETGGQMRICGLNYIIEDLFNTLNINAIIPIFPTREEALAGWN
ncbi:MAG: STAS domain-containing protein [Chitinispirillaceae bacterium]|nr:STAS domain-containing protein [Chitinispirillaceae bacterium]